MDHTTLCTDVAGIIGSYLTPLAKYFIPCKTDKYVVDMKYGHGQVSTIQLTFDTDVKLTHVDVISTNTLRYASGMGGLRYNHGLLNASDAHMISESIAQLT
jgi:hypothetical protein